MLWACSRKEPGGGAVPRVLRVAHESDLLSVDPTAFAEAATHSVLSNTFEALAAFDADMALVPALAADWSNVDERTWQIELRRGVVFHDGTPLDAAAVQRALLAARDGAHSVVRSHLAGVREVEVLASHRLRLLTTDPDPLLMNRLTYVLVSRETAAGPVGTGPYRVVRRTPGKVTEMAVFDGWRGARPAFERVEFVPMPEGEAALAALERGEIDLLRYLPATAIARVDAMARARAVSRPGLMNYYLWINPRAADTLFAKPEVRHALSFALDRAEIVRRVGGAGVASNQLVGRYIQRVNRLYGKWEIAQFP